MVNAPRSLKPIVVVIRFGICSFRPQEEHMAFLRRGQTKQIKKNSNVQRDTRDDIGTEIVQDHSAPSYRNPNRDQARGDWDRSGRRTDEGRSRDVEKDGDDGLGPASER
jgi:hypothetical protein